MRYNLRVAAVVLLLHPAFATAEGSPVSTTSRFSKDERWLFFPLLFFFLKQGG